ncbi:MAG: transcriptional regulator, winged helix family [Marmoricola sp.]|nr:transcriptional regulator, winged helix family [Marmoricola sp.]
MTPALRLLGEVSWRGAAIAGERPAALLAALALSPGGVSDAGLIDVVWDDELPANPLKALQVLVSRVRTQCGATVVTRQSGGYRLGIGPDEVDALLLGSLVEQAGERLGAGDPEKAGELARQALALAAASDIAGHDPLSQLRARARLATREAQRLRGLALTRSGHAREALDLLVTVNREGNDTPELMAALLRAEAEVSGAPAALDRYEAYRTDLRERLGMDPDESLQRVHRELLAADDPVRTGVQFDAEELLGREVDLARLRSAVRVGRLTSIIGPGGIGKTRIAHVLAREATQSRVYFVELVGITSPEDVVAEVGAALGVRGSVTGRHTHTPAQRSDIRGRPPRSWTPPRPCWSWTTASTSSRRWPR